MKYKLTLLILLVVSLMLVACDDNTQKKEGCGNGLLDLGEECDGDDLQGATCASLGFYSVLGQIQCRADCTYDLTTCGGRCGDSVVDVADGEECDGTNLIGNTCISMGYSGGTLACTASCTYDIAGCTSGCGNGYIEGGETCDDGNIGNGDGCSSTCDIEAGWECTGDSPSLCETICGDGLLAGEETCDEAELAGQTCETLGYGGGTLGCLDTCLFDESQCTME